MKVPLIIASSIICLVFGFGAGGLTGIFVGPSMPPWMGGPPERAAEENKGDAKGPMAMPMMVGKGMGGMPGKGMGGMPKGPNSKAQLSTLVTKLDALTAKPLTVTLDAEQKKQVSEQLKGLGEMEELSDDEAKQRLDAILTVLKDHKEPLEATGFRWPGEGGGGFGGGGFGGQSPANPFKNDANSKHLQSLRERLATPSS